jgi:hypothetical protein
LAVGTVAALLLLLRQAALRWAARRRLLRRMRRARQGELQAPRWLEELGYAVTGSQVASGYSVSIDGQQVAISVRADYLVERAGLRYVAEVKTGRAAPRIQTHATRRQLLEYRMAFAVDGVLLVDAETRRVHVVRFPLGLRAAAASARLAWVVTVILAGLCALAVALR